MSETKDTADKPLTPGGRKPLSLQRTVESGHVRQSFSHGRSKSVVVEKRKTRKLATPGAPAEREAVQPAAATPAPAAPKAPARPAAEARGDSGKADLLRPEERDARARALAEARKRAVEDAQRAEEERRLAPPPAPETPAPAEEAPIAKAEPAEAPAPAPSARAEPAPSAPAPRQPASGERAPSRPPLRARAPGTNDTRFAPREGGRPKQIEIPRPPSAAPAADRTAGEVTKIVKDVRAPRPAVQTPDDDESRAIKRGGKLVRVPVKAPTVDANKRERGKLTINNALDEQQRERS
ncbi:MAG TPA: translation initiation factor IF-2 associated domain-containing protein, partial [Hyphomicrobium sp.]|nr:translation initiation factor IF-2 associated domain-containing protein [Hyphomicrobium sp.]